MNDDIRLTRYGAAIYRSSLPALALFVLATGLLLVGASFQPWAVMALIEAGMLVLVVRGVRAQAAWQARDQEVEQTWLQGDFALLSSGLNIELWLEWAVRLAACLASGLLLLLTLGRLDVALRAPLGLAAVILWLTLLPALAHAAYEAYRPA